LGFAELGGKKIGRRTMNIKQFSFISTMAILGISFLSFGIALDENVPFNTALLTVLISLGISGLIILLFVGVVIIYERLE
jgi:hypothetical protein